jgi:hypothetical protein
MLFYAFFSSWTGDVEALLKTHLTNLLEKRSCLRISTKGPLHLVPEVVEVEN